MGVSALIEGRTEPQPEQSQTEPLGGTLAGKLSACLGALPPPTCGFLSSLEAASPALLSSLQNPGFPSAPPPATVFLKGLSLQFCVFVPGKEVSWGKGLWLQ